MVRHTAMLRLQPLRNNGSKSPPQFQATAIGFLRRAVAPAPASRQRFSLRGMLRKPIHENWDTNLGDELDEIGDPPRVWLTSLDQPGCAFTR